MKKVFIFSAIFPANSCMLMQDFCINIHFYIQKNRELLLKAYEDMEKIRLNVFNKYGTYNSEEKSFSFKTEQIEDINNELDDFKNIQYDINFLKVKLSDLEGLEFTLEQMEALMFMIEED